MPVEERGLSSRQTQQVARDRRLGNLATPKSVQKLQIALHAKAKAESGYRFYVLYDKISRDDILAHAYAQCRSNRGAPGVDGQDFADIVDADLTDYFGSIPHTDLLKSVARRIVDRRVLHLIKMWLDCPVEETDE